MEQINFLIQIQEIAEKEEFEKRQLRYFLKKRKEFEKWKKTPNKIFIHENSLDRAILSNIMYENYADIYREALHECAGIPDNEYIWLNHCEQDYWLLNIKGEVGGELLKDCPYCGAKLSEGKGHAVIYRADASRWDKYLTYYLPKYEEYAKQNLEKRAS